MAAQLEFVSRSNGLRYVRGDASLLGVVAGPSNGSHAQPLNPTELFGAHPEISVFVSGPMFDCCTSGCSRHYATYDCAVIARRLFDQARSIDFGGSNIHQGNTVSIIRDATGKIVPRIAEGAGKVVGATVAVQGYPTIVKAGRNVASTTRDTQVVWRNAVVIFNDGTVGLALKKDSMAAFANSLVPEGVVWALYMDGGGSGMLGVRSEPHLLGSSEHRRLPAFVVMNNPAAGIVPIRGMSPQFWTGVKWVAGTAALASAGYGIYRWMHR